MEHKIEDIRVPDFNLAGKVAVVTGGTKGLGYGMALTLAHYGADVVVASRTKADCVRVEREIKSLGRRGLGIPTDINKIERIDALVAKTVESLGRLDIMVCNAGVGNTVDAVDMTEAQWDEVVDTDLKSVFFSARAAAREMIRAKTPGKIIAIASAAAFSGARG
ncbi:MAG: SDR family NAD(P)-dependent oxidoreductase, partial [Peptococcaceae bacterium]|nr:SDR family NAD(P)-dependent oxidoreductase [Peptococcaceae bacterium]